MPLLKKAPLFLLLLVIFFCLHGSVENYGYVGATEVTETGLFILLGIAALYGLCWLIARKNYRIAALAAFFIALWYLFFGAIHDWVRGKDWLRFLHSYTAMILVLVASTGVVVYLLKRRPVLQQKLFLYLNVLLILYCVFDGYLLLRKANTEKVDVSFSKVHFNKASVNTKPNVYFLLFDCYAGYQSLRDSFGYKNDSLYRFLTARSFSIIPSISNYNFTFFSMSSILNMQYLPDYTGKVAVQRDMQERLHEIKHGQVFSIFKDMGYQVKNYSIFHLENNKGVSGNNRLIPMNAYLLTHKIFHNRVISDLGYLFYKFDYFSHQHVYAHDIDNQQAYEGTMATVEKKDGPPQFVYAHFLLPHAPYFKDSVGNYLPVSQFNVGSKKSYLSYLKYTNTVIKDLISKITTQDPGAIIVLTSDHGYNDKGKVRIYDPVKIAAEQYSFENICAVRFPGEFTDSAKTSISSVNLFRYMFNAQFGQRMPYLKDSTVWVNHD